MPQSGRKQCEGLLVQALTHMLKLALQPGSASARGWRGEVEAALGKARRCFKRSMIRVIDVQALFCSSLAIVARASHRASLPVPPACPFALDELLDPARDLNALLARLAPPGQDAAAAEDA